MSMAKPSEVVMDVRGLTKHFAARGTGLLQRHKRYVHAVDDVSFQLHKGEILALVGESGSGKSTIARVLVGLYPATAGTAMFHGSDVLRLHGRRQFLRYRGRVQMVFQDPFGSLNPVKTVGYHIERPLAVHHRARRGGQTQDRVDELLTTVGLTPPRDVAAKLPNQLSGGQRQRVSFARALAVDPEVVLADEPISMLDVSIRMGILNLMSKLRDERGLSYLYITHDLASARYIADRVLVLYAGHVMETASAEEVMADPLHPYTKLLLSAVPKPRHREGKSRIEARGEIPTVVDPKPGCRFANRCPFVMDRCRVETPPLIQVRSDRLVRCYLYDGPVVELPAVVAVG
jgi:peptide/nickel transport system ATP-binding protein